MRSTCSCIRVQTSVDLDKPPVFMQISSELNLPCFHHRPKVTNSGLNYYSTRVPRVFGLYPKNTHSPHRFEIAQEERAAWRLVEEQCHLPDR